MISSMELKNHIVHITLSGKIYVEEATEIREKLLKEIEKGHAQFIIHFSQVQYIDSSGLGVIVAIQKRALQKGGKVTIQGLKGGVKELFELTRLNRVFEIHP